MLCSLRKYSRAVAVTGEKFCTSAHPSIRCPSEGSESQLEGSESQLVRSEGLPEESEGLPERSEGLSLGPEGPEGLPEGSLGLPKGSLGLPERSLGLPVGPEGLLEGPEGLPEGPEGLPGGPRAGGQMDVWTDKWTEFFPILWDLVPCRGRCPKIETITKDIGDKGDKQGQSPYKSRAPSNQLPTEI